LSAEKEKFVTNPGEKAETWPTDQTTGAFKGHFIAPIRQIRSIRC
jgi:hypothetical protein